jgi:hypothetical protein
MSMKRKDPVFKHKEQWRNTELRNTSRAKSRAPVTAMVRSSYDYIPTIVNLSQSGLEWLEQAINSHIVTSSDGEEALIKFSLFLKNLANSGIIEMNLGMQNKAIKAIICKVIRLDKWKSCDPLKLWMELRTHLKEETHLKFPISCECEYSQ